MNKNAFIVAILIAFAVFVIIIAVASIQYQKAINMSRSSKDNEWLFHDFYLKVYSAIFGYKDPDEVALMIGIKIEKYYISCKLTQTVPNTKRLVVHHIYGFIILLISALFAILWNFLALLIGITVFLYFVYSEQSRLDKKAEEMRFQVASELPRFLDLLQTELQIGLPIETAIYILCTRLDGLLSREFLEALNEMEMGTSGWQQALENVASKYNVDTLSNFVMDVTTAYSKGVSVSASVTRKAKDIKSTHLLNIKERAGKATNTILIPIAIFQFLPLLAFLMIPALVQVMEGL